MKILKLAAGVAVGYVLGARAGREQYERIAEQARRLSGSPKVEQAKQKVKDTAGAKLDDVAERAGAGQRTRRARSKPATVTPPAESVVAATSTSMPAGSSPA
jgi:hypothetical protein